MEEKARSFSPIEFVEHWPHGPAAADAEKLVRFWLAENAFSTEADARRRLPEVILHAHDSAGEIAGVCTAAPMVLPRLGEPMYYYRCLIGRRWRSTVLVMSMLKRASFLLEEYAVAHAYPCIGIVLELENGAFAKALDSPIWPNAQQRGYVYIGKSRDGLDLRIAYFRGAKLTRGAPVAIS